MQTYFRVRSHVAEDGSLTVEHTPFAAGQEVEVIVLSDAQASDEQDRYPLRGTVLTYIDPLLPVAEDDWEALKGFCWILTSRSGGCTGIHGSQQMRRRRSSNTKPVAWE